MGVRLRLADLAPGLSISRSPPRGVVYIAPIGNFAFLGDAPLTDIATQIRRAHGPSGSNADYLKRLAHSLRELGADDPHIFELENLIDR